MPAIPFIGLAIAAASAGFSAHSTIKEAKKQKKARKRQVAAQREAARIQQVKSDVEARRERKKQLRETRIRKAQILSTAVLSGAGGSSTTAGAVGSIGTQFGANVGRINEAQGFGGAISTQNEEAARQQGKIAASQGRQQATQAITGAISSTASSVGNIFDRAGGDTSAFGGNTFRGDTFRGNTSSGEYAGAKTFENLF